MSQLTGAILVLVIFLAVAAIGALTGWPSYEVAKLVLLTLIFGSLELSR